MKLFGKNKKQFDYQSDAQLVAALIAGQQAAFDYVFDRYHELLRSNIEKAFHIKEEDDVERTIKKRCDELQRFLLAENGTKLKNYNPKEANFNAWLSTVSLFFFKKTFSDENIDLVERYREGDKTVVYERFQNRCKEIIKKIGGEESDSTGQAMLLLEDLHKRLLKDNCKKLNTYNPTLKSFDDWFCSVIHNYWIDYLNADNENKLKKKVIDSGGFVRIDDKDTPPGWDNKILILDDKDKIELIKTIKQALKTLEPPRYHDILVDLFYKGKTYDEITEIYQVTKANAYNIVSRALDRLKTIIEEEYGLRTKR